MQLVDVDRFNRRWSSRERVKISRCETGKRIALQAKISFQVFLGSVMQRNPSADSQQNWPMKNHNQRRGYGKREQRPAAAGPTPPVRLRLCLTVFGHQGDFISALTKSKWTPPATHRSPQTEFPVHAHRLVCLPYHPLVQFLRDEPGR